MLLFPLPFLKQNVVRLLLTKLIPISATITLFIYSFLFSVLISFPVVADPTSQNHIHKNINDFQLKFSQFSANEGLSSSNAFAITQDQQGYLWIATEDGLNRFDGKNFQVYRHDIANAFSISDNVIRKIFIDSNNTLWIGTQNGLSRYNRELDNFDNFHHDVNNANSLKDNIIWDIYQDQNQRLWVSTSTGVQSLDVTNLKQSELSFQPLKVHDFKGSLLEIKTIYQDKQGNYWLGSYGHGIHLVNNNFYYVGSLQGDNKYKLSIDATALFDLKEIDDSIWLATDNGLFVIDHHYKLSSHIFARDNNEYSNTDALNKNLPTLLSNHIRAIEQYDDNNIWLATNDGLNIINLLNGTISSHTKSAYSTSLSDNWLMDIFKDANGTMWLGSYGGGLNKYSPLNSMLYHGLAEVDNITKHNYRVESFTQTDSDAVYLSTEQQGVFKLENNAIYQENFNIPSGVRQILSGKDTLWILSREGSLYQKSTLTKNNEKHQSWDYLSGYSTHQLVYVINNHLWYLNTKGMLTSYNTSTKEFSTHLDQESNIFSKLHKDGNSKLWLISQDNNIVTYDPQALLFSPPLLTLNNDINSEKITSIAISQQYIWLGSDSQGITLIDRTSNKHITFNEKNGLKNNYIASILIDDQSNAWIATNKGISVISSEANSILHFDADFSLNMPEFIKYSALKKQNGELYFGSPTGFYQFLPSELLSITQVINPPLFTNLYIANKKVKIQQNPTIEQSDKNNKKAPYTLSKQLNSLTKVILRHSHSPVSFEFVSPNTKLPHQLNYHYRLQGLESDWIEADKNNLKATYTNLAPGNYTFEVQAYDSQSAKISSISKLQVHILAPWWLTNSAIFIYLLLSLLFISFVFQQARNRRLYHLKIKQNEERLKLSLWGSGDEMWDWNMLSGKVFRSNIWGKLEFPQDGSRNTLPQQANSTHITQSPESNIHHHDIVRVKHELNEHIKGLSNHYEAAYRVQDKDGNWIWVLDRGKIVERNEQGKPTRMTGTLKDISQIKNTEETLKLFARCIENISDAVVIYDKDFIAVDVNKAFVQITGKTRELMIGKPLSFSQYPDKFCESIKQHLITKGRWHGEIESLHQNEDKYFTDLNIDVIYDEDQSISHFVSVFSDITKRKATESELRRLASSDTLTGLPNRTFFQLHQTKLVKNKTPHALLVFDLDNFKKINDSLGHQVGDAILCKIAERIVNIGRPQDTVYRLGGDEFSILIENTNDIHTITSISNEVLQCIAMPFKLKNQEIVLFSSIGIVLYPDDGLSPHELLKNADTAMYHAKNAGGNRYQFFNESMNKEAVHRLQVETLIRHGLREDSFSVYYQPKISIKTGQVAGMEALVRFETPAKGIISPAVFIPVSEETGQIIDIGEIVLRKACFATKKWVDAGLFNGRVAVNLSAVQFTQANLVALIASILKESQLPAKYLELEITEGTVMNAPQKAIETMNQIRDMGIHLSLDDFGTGYSSLAYLKKFPLNTLKIDKAFVDDIEVSEQGRNMVATIVTIAHNLTMQVVAEGVETNKQLDFLSSLGCEQLQGYLYSKPLPRDNFHQYLISHQVTQQSTSFNQL
ncbi:EAL domain-containing protein [Colwellia asteriadis]|uniref:EAL domain-containing protein n=1 Tax=Colwellia asteriadis TaxID=517723 RepID=A0ABN1LAE3_9GAMM